MNTTPRDGVINADGLSAEFRFIRPHPSPDSPVSFVETATGAVWVLDDILTYDAPKQPAPNEK